MKKFYLFLFLLAGGFVSSMSAQENLNKWIKKCESVPSIEITLINAKNPQTGKKKSETTRVLFSKNPNLVKDLYAAFEKDKERAYSVSETKKNGKSRPRFCSFMNTKDRIQTTYVFERRRNDTILVIKKITYDYEAPIG